MDSTAPGHDDELVAKARVGLLMALLAFTAFTLADLALHTGSLGPIVAIRLVQFALVGAAWGITSTPMSYRMRLHVTVAVVGAIYVTSAVAGVLRGGVATQPITDLAIAFTTATTLPWGGGPQLASVTIAAGAIAWAFLSLHGSWSGVSPHMVAGIGVAFLISVHIAHQLARYRRERDVAEDALRRNEERFRSLIERGSDVITIVDAEGFIRYESPSIERLLGYAPEALLGKRAADQIHPDDLDAVRAAFAASADGGTASTELRVARSDGSWCDVEASFTNLLDHPAVGGVVANWRDISERRRAEAERAGYVRELAAARDQALASMRAKSRFLANMSHEIRTPMNVVIGLADMLLDTALAADQRQDLVRLRESAVGLLGILNDVLDASKIEAGKMTLEVVPMDLRHTVDEAVRLLTPAAQAKGLALTGTVTPELPAQVYGDPGRIRQTLVNLLGNAIKFTDTGGVALAVQAQRRGDTHVAVRVTVTDTGVGIPPERQATIFESFAQGDDSTTRVYGGTGLGLSISRELVTLMGGRIGVESAPGRGSVFWVELTLACRAPAAGVAAA